MKKVSLFLLILFSIVFIVNCNLKAEKPVLEMPEFVIDSHMHYGPLGVAYDDPNYETELVKWENEFLAFVEKYNVVVCLLIGRNWESNNYWQEIERGIKFAKEHPDRVIPYSGLDIDNPNIILEVQKAYDMGYKGLGELFAVNQWNYDDPKYDPIWALAEKLGMPIAPHTGILTYGILSRMRPGYLGTIAYKFPKLYIHAAHFGNPWYNEAGEVTRRNKNLYFDITGSSLIKMDNNPAYWNEFLWWTPYLGKAHMPKDAVPAFEKLVFGTDEDPIGFEENIMRFNKMLNACGVSKETRDKCYYETMARIHNIDVSKYLK